MHACVARGAVPVVFVGSVCTPLRRCLATAVAAAAAAWNRGTPSPSCFLLPPNSLLPPSPARYISLAYAMQPSKQVYADSLSAVQRLLPLPWLRSGPLLAVHPQTEGTPGEQWVPCWFGLDHNGLQAVRPPTAFAGQHGLPSAPLPIGFELADVVDARRVNDPSLPAGAPFWLGLRSKPRWAGNKGVVGVAVWIVCLQFTLPPMRLK